MKKVRKPLILAFVLSALALSCVAPNVTNSEQGLTKSEIESLDKEYSKFESKALTKGYLKRKLEFLISSSGVKLVKEIEYARVKGEDSVPFDSLMTEETGLLEDINEVSEVIAEKGINSPFAAFLYDLSPTPVPSGMVLVQGGTFNMGDTLNDNYYTNEKPVHSVTLGSFYIGKYEVIQQEYFSVMGTNPSYQKGNNLPVERVTWISAISYCNALSALEGLPPAYNGSYQLLDSSGSVTTDTTKVSGYRLPTEAEWEFAARGGNSSTNKRYSGSDTIGDVAWYIGNSSSKTKLVGTKNPNELGIYDMSGNVSEMVYDQTSDTYYSISPSINPYNHNSAINSSLVIRGGNWGGSENHVRVAYRSYTPLSIGYTGVGFRVVRTAP